jgi:hypothetical protein
MARKQFGRLEGALQIWLLKNNIAVLVHVILDIIPVRFPHFYCGTFHDGKNTCTAGDINLRVMRMCGWGTRATPCCPCDGS